MGTISPMNNLHNSIPCTLSKPSVLAKLVIFSSFYNKIVFYLPCPFCYATELFHCVSYCAPTDNIQLKLKLIATKLMNNFFPLTLPTLFNVTVEKLLSLSSNPVGNPVSQGPLSKQELFNFLTKYIVPVGQQNFVGSVLFFSLLYKWFKTSQPLQLLSYPSKKWKQPKEGKQYPNMIKLRQLDPLNYMQFSKE